MAEPFSTGLELTMNAAEGVLQIVLTNNESPLCFEEWFLPRQATEILTPALKQIFARLGFKFTDLRRIACVAGPGSFTGIRLVLSTAAAIRRVTRAQLASLDYLQALATSAVMRRGLLYPDPVFVLTHARRNLIHFREYMSFGAQIPAQPVGEVELMPPARALKSLAAKPCCACGGAIAEYPQYFAPMATGKGPKGAPKSVMLAEVTKPSLEALCLLARHGDYFPRDLDPQYVRGCDAIENMPQIADKRGQDLDAMRENLEGLLTNEPKSEI